MNRYVALAVFASYFAIIAVILGILLNILLRQHAIQKNTLNRKRATLFFLLAIGSFMHTWYCCINFMIRYVQWSLNDYETKVGTFNGTNVDRLGKWLINTALFEQAWYTVCSGPVNWWISQQLCSYTVGAWTIFIFVEGKHRQIKHAWMYMLLGQLVAISVASNLFYVALCLSTTPPTRQDRSASPVLWLSIFLSLVTVSYSPFTDERIFLPNLLVMHTLAAVPLFFRPYLDTSFVPRFSLSFSSLYLLVFVVTAFIHMWNSMVLYYSLDEPFVGALWGALFSHPAQSSIGWDVIWTSVSFVIWAITSQARHRFVSLVTPLISVGVVAPALASLEYDGQGFLQGSPKAE
ncbi:hypothetical protein EV359DRAFT_48573 [Lentinula novae-zelandiae]|nr:hypothetical protein EV359DRAFT_48573 [Lentinula novae-zelandiae]